MFRRTNLEIGVELKTRSGRANPNMASTKEIRIKIRSIENTRKITRAMQMVAASKMRRSQERMQAARPYGEKIRNIAAHMSHATPEYRHQGRDITSGMY